MFQICNVVGGFLRNLKGLACGQPVDTSPPPAEPAKASQGSPDQAGVVTQRRGDDGEVCRMVPGPAQDPFPDGSEEPFVSAETATDHDRARLEGHHEVRHTDRVGSGAIVPDGCRVAVSAHGRGIDRRRIGELAARTVRSGRVWDGGRDDRMPFEMVAQEMIEAVRRRKPLLAAHKLGRAHVHAPPLAAHDGCRRLNLLQ